MDLRLVFIKGSTQGQILLLKLYMVFVLTPVRNIYI